MKEAILYLEDGTSFIGQTLSAHGESAGEVLFNTAMTGYQEILTDPSYAGQIVVMTYPLIGNYGINEEDVESAKIHLKGFVVKEFCRHHSNFRATQSLIKYLNDNNIISIEGLDTRALTRHLREKGAMKGIISTKDMDHESLSKKLKEVPSMEGADWVKEVTTKEKYIWSGPWFGKRERSLPVRQAGKDKDQSNEDKDSVPAHRPEGSEQKYKVAAIDCGIKFNILRILTDLGCEVHIFPAHAKAKEINSVSPDGLFISNGPGDPAAVPYVAETIKEFIGKIPIFGICLGHQILSLALGGKTFKLKFGHHGANHPVKDLLDNRIGITSQNHGFCVDIDSLAKDDIEMVDINLNDQTLEGMTAKFLDDKTLQMDLR